MTFTEAKAHGWARRACWGNRTLRVRQTPVGTIEARETSGIIVHHFTLGGSDFAATDWEPWVSEPSAIERASRLQTSAGELLAACEAALALLSRVELEHRVFQGSPAYLICDKLRNAIASAKGTKL